MYLGTVGTSATIAPSSSVKEPTTPKAASAAKGGVEKEERVNKLLDLFESREPGLTQQLSDGIATFFGHNVEVEEVTRIMRTVVTAADETYSMLSAEEDGAGFEFDTETLTRDEALLEECGGDFPTLVKHLQSLRAQMTTESIDRVTAGLLPADDEDVIRLKELVAGIRVDLDDDFVHMSEARPLRELYEHHVHGTVNRRIEAAHRACRVVILPLDIGNALKGRVLSDLGCAKKKGVPGGRTTFDGSNGPENNNLNTLKSKVLARLRYGPVSLPTIEELMCMILEFMDEQRELLGELFNEEELMLISLDLRAAFELLRIHPDDTVRMGARITGNMIVFFLYGNFGTTVVPFAFHVVPRVLERVINMKTHGKSKWYTDDCCGVTLEPHTESDMAIIRSTATELLAEGAVAEDKDQRGRQVEWIGWLVCLDSMTVTLSVRNLHTSLYAFLAVDVNGSVTIKELQRLQSLAYRGSIMMRAARPYLAPLYAETTGIIHQNITKPELKLATRRAIWFWRIAFMALVVDRVPHSRSIESFRPNRCATHEVCFDAELRGLGFQIRAVGPDDVTIPDVLKCGKYRLDANFDLGGESRYQNTVEFIAAIIGTVVIAQMGVRNASIRLKGDSKVCLAWGTSERFKGCLSQNAAIVFIMTSMAFGSDVVGSLHFGAKDNTVCDGLSRDKISPRDICEREDQILDLQNDPVIQRFVRLCDPTRNVLEAVTDRDDRYFGTELCGLWRSIKEGVDAIDRSDW